MVEALDIEQFAAAGDPPASIEVPLTRGRTLSVSPEGGDERVTISGASGEVLLTVRLTDAGPVLRLEGHTVEIAATETLALKAKRVELDAESSATIRSKGTMDVNAAGEMTVTSTDDIRMIAKMIHLN